MSQIQVFKKLKSILTPYEKHLACTQEDNDNYYLNTRHIMKNKKPLFFGAVQIKKNYVSFHLMPVYVDPTLLHSMSEPLKKHMHGKSCFNFKNVEEIPLEELTELTKAGFENYQIKGFI